MRTMSILVLLPLVGCLGSGPSESPSYPSDDQADDGTPRLPCPEGTTQQSGTNPVGEEYYCHRVGVMHGPYLRFHANGSRAASGNWDNNQRSGQWTFWYDNEQTERKGKYERGKQTGSWTWWHENGNRKQEGDFLLGRKQGQWRTYFESGAKESEGLYHNDMKTEKWSYFDDDEADRVVRTERYENGELVDDKKGKK